MEAVVLAGGVGSRLRQVIADLPKPMAPVAGRPFLEILLELLARKGFTNIILSLGFMSEKIRTHFGLRFSGMDITYVVEQTPLGTGGAIRLALDACVEEHVFIFNGDTYLDLDIELILKQWKARQNPIVVCRKVADASRYGRIVLDGNRITNFAEKGISGPSLINAGCYLLGKNSLAGFDLNEQFSIETDFFQKEVALSEVEAFEAKGMFIDIGIPDDYFRAQSMLFGR